MVSFEAKAVSQRYVEETALVWPLLIDEDRKLYHAYGMFSASFWNIWGPKTWFAYLKALFKGQKLRKSEADVMQRGGNVLIDPNGIVQMIYVGKGPGDRPGFKRVLNIIDKG